MFKKYKDKGLRILAFPANNFANQEPGTNQEIKTFCSTKMNVSFDVFAKISVKGEDQHPLYKWLTTYPEGDISGDVAWNFQKYLIGRDGKILAKFGPRTLPDDAALVRSVEEALEESGGQ